LRCGKDAEHDWRAGGRDTRPRPPTSPWAAGIGAERTGARVEPHLDLPLLDPEDTGPESAVDPQRIWSAVGAIGAIATAGLHVPSLARSFLALFPDAPGHQSFHSGRAAALFRMNSSASGMTRTDCSPPE
jgi:hypothetical protein